MKDIRDVSRPYFFSRKWAQEGYNPSQISYEEPLLIFLERSAQMKWSSASLETTYTFEVATLDRYVDKDLVGRLKLDIYRDTEEHLYKYLTYLMGCKYYRVTGDASSGIYHPDHIDLIPGIDTYVEDVALSRQWLNIFVNNQSPLYRWEGGMRDLSGSFMELQIRVKRCLDYEYRAEFNTFKYLGDRG